MSLPSRVIASVANYFTPMKTKAKSLSLLIAAGLLLSSVTASATTIYGLTTVNGTQYDLSPNAYLAEANLSYADLYSADLTNASLYSANLTNANLTEAQLSFAYLAEANLSYANLSYANLSYANLTGATVSYSNWTDFSTNSGASGLGSYLYDTSLINYAGNGAIPEPSTYGLIGIGALGVAFAARRRKLKAV